MKKHEVYDEIERTMVRAQRDAGGPVLPWMVQARLDFYRAEGSLRRDMYDMYKSGRLIRVGGEGARQGYRLPTAVERLCWHLNMGMWPHGVERIRYVKTRAVLV